MYAEAAVAPALRRWFSAAWTVRPQAGTSHRILPDGHVDLVWLPGEEAPLVAGPATRPAFAPPADGVVRGLRFAAGAAPALLGVAAHELRDLTVPLSALGSRPAREPDALVRAGAEALRAEPGLRMSAVAAAVGLSERQLRRRFVDWVGYGPKRYARICRLQRMLALAPGEPDGAALAVTAGYADQPHMVREVRELAGVTPGTLLAERGRFLQAAEPVT